LWAGAFLSTVGTWTQDVALAWLIHSSFDNPFFLGLRSFAAEAPLLALMLVGGAMADRVDRRRILLASQSIQMTLAAVLLALFLTGNLGLTAILAIAFLTGLTQSQSAPTYQAVLTSIVPPQQISRAVALNSLQFNLSRAIGPVIAGVLLARGGTGACFAVNVASYVAVIFALTRIQVPPPEPGASSVGLGTSLRAGLRHVGEHDVLWRLTLLAACSSFLAFPLTTYLPVFADQVQGTGATGYSMLLTAYGLGAIGGALSTAQRGSVPGRGRYLLRAFALFGLSALGALFSPWSALSLAFMLAAGWSLVTAYSTLISLVQENAQDALRGRIMSIFGLCFRSGMPLGSLAFGALIVPLGVRAVIGTSLVGLVLLVAGLEARRGVVARL
jgi:predicted MFS family arabinose efflux permease